MSYYDKNPKDLAPDTMKFLDSEYGKHIVSTLEDMSVGYLAVADNMECPYPERYLAKHSAVKEVLDLIKQPIS